MFPFQCSTLSTSCNEVVMSGLLNQQFRQLSSSINVPFATHSEIVNSIHNSPCSPFADLNNNALSKSWSVNGSKLGATSFERQWLEDDSPDFNSANVQSSNNLNNSQLHIDKIKDENGLVELFEMKPQVDRPPLLPPYSNCNEQPRISLTAQGVHSRSSIASFRGFTSCDEGTLRMQIQAASSCNNGFNSNQLPLNQRQMYRHVAANYPLGGNQPSHSTENNGQQNQTIPSIDTRSDYLNDNSLQLSNGTDGSGFTLAQSQTLNQCNASSTATMTTPANELDNFIQELCQKNY